MASALREATRSLAKTPMFTATATISVAVAVGLTASIFSVAYAAFFGRLPYPEPERLVELWQTEGPDLSQPSDYLAPVRMLEWVDAEARHLESIAATGTGSTLILDGDPPLGVYALPTAGDWFATMGVPAARGRVLVRDDARPGAEPAMVVSDRFAREYDLELGSSMMLSDVGYTVVGIMSREFESAARVWIPVEALPVGAAPIAYAGVARVRAGSTVNDAALEIQQMSAAQVAADSARYSGLGATARQFGAMARGMNRSRLWLLAGVVAAVILIGLSNLTQLFLLRAQSRTRALAVRGALGGTPWQIAGGLAVEGATVGFLGGALGLLLAIWGKDVVRRFVASEYVLPSEPTIGLAVIAFALGTAMLVSVIVGLEPLRRVRSLDLQVLLQRQAAGSLATPADRRSQRLMVVVQVATCVVLVAIATVLGSAYRALQRLDLGYDADAIVQAKPDYAIRRMSVSEQWDLARAVADRVERRPGVAGVAVWEKVGEDYPPRPELDAVFDGPPPTLDRRQRLNVYYAVEPGFFDVLGIDVLAGRALATTDGPSQPPVVVVTETGANAWWPGEEPIGRQLKLGQNGPWMTVVGVTTDIYDLDELGRSIAVLGAQRPFIFVPYAQMPTPPTGWRPYGCCWGVMVGARPEASTATAAEALRSEFALADPSLPVDIGTMTALQVRNGYTGNLISMTGRMVGAGTVIALLLAAFGIVGVVREGMARRTREIGLRIALGARAHQVMGIAALESALTTLVGVGLGLGALVPLGRILSDLSLFRFDVDRLTEGVLALPVLVVTTVAVIAGTASTAVATAARAARIDPAEALRND